MTTINKFIRNACEVIILAAVMANAHGAITDISQGPLVTSSSSTLTVKPNIFLMMDDSGSMGWSHMPDDAADAGSTVPMTYGYYGFRSSQCNGIYYDPTINYTAPLKADGTSYANASFTGALNDGYTSTSGTVDLSTSYMATDSGSISNQDTVGVTGYYYQYTGSQLTENQKQYYTSTSTFFKECSSANGAAPGNAVFTKYRLSPNETTTITISASTASSTFTITVSGGVSTPVSSITVGGTTITSGTSTGSTNNNTEASNLASKITANGYSASNVSGTSVITVTGPASVGASVVVNKSSGSDTFTASTVSPINTVSSIKVGTTELLLSGSAALSSNTTTTAANIAAKINATGYTATSSGNVITITGPTSAANLTPAMTYTGAMTYTTDVFPDTTAAKLTNFANWFSYYSTRLNMMKTATGQAFKNIGKNYRVGFATMNNNGGTDFINPAPLVDTTSPVSTQRTNFYAKLYATKSGNSTPLLDALSRAGLLYAHKLSSNKLNTVTANDPIEYSCQQNFTILSTDGFWNSASSTTITSNGSSSPCSPSAGSSSTAVGNCDGTEVRPMYDGATTTTKTATPTTTVNHNQTVTNQNTTKIWSHTVTTTAATKGTGGCSSSKYLVTAQPQTYNELINSTLTTVGDYATTVTSTVTTINGISGAPVLTTGATTSSNVTSSSVTNSDTGAPTGSTTWTNNGSATTSCSSSPTPSAGTSTTSSASAGSPTTINGASTVTTLSTASTVGTPTVTVTASGGTSNTLADVAEYYYVTDLRDASLSNATGALSTDVTQNNVPTSGLDAASWQHMTTFTLGLGARGRMVFSPTYQTDTSGDYYSVLFGSLADSTKSPAVCSWQPNGTVCNWPTPDVSGVPENIDDLWHAAVNGRGAYFNATNPAALATGMSAALAGVSARTGSSASASISNPNISTGDNFIFSSDFVTYDWYGHLIRQQLNLSTGALSSTVDWEAGALLDNNTARNIYAFSATAANHLQAFNSTNFGSNASFATANISSLSQFCVTGTNCLTAAQQTAAAGANLVAYLTGDRTNEGYPADPTKYYRQRLHLLGDIVDSQATYVKAPLLQYTDTGYSDFTTASANRQSMIYVGANDGMLHAFYATSDAMDSVTGNVVTSGGVNVNGGDEAWAFVPTAVIHNLYKLADMNYASQHQYFVDGSPLTTDICPTTPVTQCSGTTWKTILVGGLNGGGNSYYALDITNPANPLALWEFTNANLGNSFGNPQVVKLGGTATTGPMAAGTWVVLLTSGYNNADGNGHLFVLNAYTGALLLDINDGVGSATSPSGLSRIIAQVVNPSLDATVLQVYGGDLMGNLWRFDVNGNVGATGYDAQLLATLTGPNGVAEPITAKPEVGLVNGKVVVYVGTGRYLGVSDIDGTVTTQLSPNLQTMYGIMDPLLTTSTPSVAIYANIRTQTTLPFVKQTEFTTTCPSGAPATLCIFGQIVRTSTSNAVSIPAVNSGWYVDFPDSGERLNTDPVLELGMLAFNTNVPSATACTIGGNSYNYVLDYSTGSFLVNAVTTITAAMAATLPAGMYKTLADGTITMGIVAGQHTGSLSTAPIFIDLPNGQKALCTNDSTGMLICRLVNPPPPTGGARRVSWRQLLSQ